MVERFMDIVTRELDGWWPGQVKAANELLAEIDHKELGLPGDGDDTFTT